MKHVIIFNPAAGSGRAAAKRNDLEKVLRREDMAVDIWGSTWSGEAIELAERAAAEADVVVAAGGDGTVQEVAIGLMQAPAGAALGVLPLGTGNDFAKAIGMPRRWQDAVSALSDAETTDLDLGRVRWRTDTENTNGEHYFVNALGVGFDAQVARAALAATHLRGTAAYLAAVFRTLRHWQGPSVIIRDGRERTLYEGPLFLATLGNGICSGGGFYLTPTASPTDGVLDLCVIEHLDAVRVCQLIPLVFRGLHATQPEVRMHRLRRTTMQSPTGLPVHADGELLTESAREINVEILPSRLPVRRPVSG